MLIIELGNDGYYGEKNGKPHCVQSFAEATPFSTKKQADRKLARLAKKFPDFNVSNPNIIPVKKTH